MATGPLTNVNPSSTATATAFRTNANCREMTAMEMGPLTNVTRIVTSMGSLTVAKLTATATARLMTVRIWPIVMPMASQTCASLQTIATAPEFRTAANLKGTIATATAFRTIAI